MFYSHIQTFIVLCIVLHQDKSSEYYLNCLLFNVYSNTCEGLSWEIR